MSVTKPAGSITVQWAFVVGVFDGMPHLINHDFAAEVKAGRLATLDDIYAACFVATHHRDYWFTRPSTDPYTCAFVVFQMPDGRIAASPDVFENLIPVSSQNDALALGAFGVLQAQIIAQKTADIAVPLAVEATLSVLRAGAKQQAKEEGKSEGGLFVA